MKAAMFACLFVSLLGLAWNANHIPTCSLLAPAHNHFALPCSLQGGNAIASLGLAQGLPSTQALKRGFWGFEKGPKENKAMASSSSDSQRRNKKPSWADMVMEGPKKAFPDKKAKEEVEEVEEVEEEEWWHKGWKKGGKSWDEWWKDREDEWQEWKDYEREEGEKANATKNEADKMKHQCKKEEEEESVLQGTPARWKNRNGSTKERGRRKWMEGKAREAGQDEDHVDLVKLAALGNSRMNGHQAAR